MIGEEKENITHMSSLSSDVLAFSSVCFASVLFSCIRPSGPKQNLTSRDLLNQSKENIQELFSSSGASVSALYELEQPSLKAKENRKNPPEIVFFSLADSNCRSKMKIEKNLYGRSEMSHVAELVCCLLGKTRFSERFTRARDIVGGARTNRRCGK